MNIINAFAIIPVPCYFISIVLFSAIGILLNIVLYFKLRTLTVFTL